MGRNSHACLEISAPCQNRTKKEGDQDRPDGVQPGDENGGNGDKTVVGGDVSYEKMVDAQDLSHACQARQTSAQKHTNQDNPVHLYASVIGGGGIRADRIDGITDRRLLHDEPNNEGAGEGYGNACVEERALQQGGKDGRRLNR